MSSRNRQCPTALVPVLQLTSEPISACISPGVCPEDMELLFKCERIYQLLGQLTQASRLIQPLSTGFPTSRSKEGSAFPVRDTTKPNQLHIQGFTWISVHCIAEFHRLDHRFVPDLLLSALINQHLEKHEDFTKFVLEYFYF